MINSQKPDKISLGNLIENIKKGKYVIPDFQREFDWQPWDVRDLVKSIFMDYYIGTLLLWEGKKKNYEILDCKPLFAFEGESNPDYIVLDGQQRITALHYAIFQPHKTFRNKKSRFYFFININHLLNNNFDEAFFYNKETKHFNELINTPEKQFESHIFPLGILKGGTWDLQQWLLNYQNYWNTKADEEGLDEVVKQEFINYALTTNQIKEIFFNILNNYQISFIELNQELPIDKVCEIFTHINSKGVKLDTFDLLNAVTRPKDIFLKEMYRQASDRLDDTTFPGSEIKSYILMVMSILKQRYCSPMYLYYLVPNEIKTIKKLDGSTEQVVLINSSEEFKELWDIAVCAIETALKTLKNPRDLGAVSKRFLPYPSIIPVLSAIKYHVKTTTYENMIDVNNKINQWYWTSIFLNRYSSSVETTTTKDFQDLIKWFKNDEDIPSAVSDFIRDYQLLSLEKESYSGSSIYKAIFNLYIINGAKDWSTFSLPEYNDIDDHHIVPKSWGKNNGLNSEINTILNRAPLTPETNRTIINDRLPNVYIKEMFDNNDENDVYKILDSHLINKDCVEILLRNPFTKEDYIEFISKRKERIFEEISNKIIKNTLDLPPNLVQIDEDIEDIELALRDVIKEKLEIDNRAKFFEKIPSHILEKVQLRVEKEFKRNSALKTEKENDPDLYFEYLDLQELNTIITSKVNWELFECQFGSKDFLTQEFNFLAGLRNAIRHSRTVDKINEMKGQAAILWFKKQLQ